MAHSYVDFRGRYQHMQDSDLVWLTSSMAQLRDEVELPAGSSKRIGEMMEWWSSPESNPGPGCMDLKLDKFILTEEDIDCCRQLLAMVEGRLRSFGDTVPSDYLNGAVRSSTLQFGDVATEQLLGVVRQFRGLLSDAS